MQINQIAKSNDQSRIQNLVKHLRWKVLLKYFKAFIRSPFSQKAPSLFDWVLNTPLTLSSKIPLKPIKVRSYDTAGLPGILFNFYQ